jgi:hypothetical protein
MFFPSTLLAMAHTIYEILRGTACALKIFSEDEIKAIELFDKNSPLLGISNHARVRRSREHP